MFALEIIADRLGDVSGERADELRRSFGRVIERFGDWAVIK